MAEKTITVSAQALHAVLAALVGPGHLIRELQATRDKPPFMVGNPIDTLITQYHAAIEATPAEPATTLPEGWKAVPPNWVAIPLEPTENQWMLAQGTLLDMGWDATTCLAARVQTLIACTRKQLQSEIEAAMGPAS